MPGNEAQGLMKYLVSTESHNDIAYGQDEVIEKELTVDNQVNGIDTEAENEMSSGSRDISNHTYTFEHNDQQNITREYEHISQNNELNVNQNEQVANQTYSDVEADQFEATAPYETSTPTLTRKDIDNEHAQDNSTDVTSNRTYTLEDNEIQDDEPIRIFIALYDYNPVIQSPNPDAEEEELAFNEGDLIKVSY